MTIGVKKNRPARRQAGTGVANDQEWQEGSAFVLVKAGCNEPVHLRGDDRKCDHQRTEHRNFDLREEELLRRRVDELDVAVAEPAQLTAHLNGRTRRLNSCLANRSRRGTPRRMRPPPTSTALAQFDQMLDKRLRPVLDIAAHASPFLREAARVFDLLAAGASPGALRAGDFLGAFRLRLLRDGSARLLRLRSGLGGRFRFARLRRVGGTVHLSRCRAHRCRRHLIRGYCAVSGGVGTDRFDQRFGRRGGWRPVGRGRLLQIGLDSLPSCRSGFIASRNAAVGLRLCASLIVLRTSSRSASRSASSNCRRKSDAMAAHLGLIRQTRAASAAGPSDRRR